MLNLIRNTISNYRTSQATEDSNNFLAAAGITGQVQSQAIYNLVNDLQASGLWSKMKAVYPMVTDNRNIFSYTEDFTNTVWQKSGISATGDTTTAPNGTLTADTIQNNNTSGYMRQVNLILSSGQYTQSAYFKKNNNDWVSVYTSDGGANYAIAYFNINTGVVGTVSAIGTFSAATSSIENVGSGWYRCSLTFTKPTTASTEVSTIIPDANNTFSRTIGQNTFIWGAQLEQSSTLSTYQPILTTPAAFMASQMKYNLKDARDLDAAFRLTWSGGWTYSATGATPNGTNAYADTKFNLLNNVPGYNNAFGVYYRTNNYGVFKVGALGTSFDLGMSAHLGWQNSSSNLYNDNLGRNVINNSAYGTFDAFHISTVTSTSSQKLYRNGVLKLSGAATNGITLPSINFYYGAANVNGTATYFDNQQWSFGILSTGLTDQDAQLLNQIVEKYQVALSRGVQAAQSFYYNSAYSNEANTYLYSTQITGTTQVSAINTLINGLKANNLWSKMKAVYPFVTDKTLQADMAAQMKFNLVNPQDSDAAFRLAFSGGWTYSTNGAQPNGTNGYADTKLNLASTLTQNDTHMSYYSRTNIIAANVEMGAIENTNIGTYLLYNFNGIAYKAFNSLESARGSTYNPTTGILIGSRINSSTEKYYYRGALVDTLSVVSQPLVPRNVFIGAYSANGSPYQYSSKQTAFATIGTGLSDAEVTILTQLVTDYQTTLSRQV